MAGDEDRTGAAPPDGLVEGGASPEAGEPSGPAAGTVEVIERHKSGPDLLRELLPEIGILAVGAYLWILAGRFDYQQEEGALGPGFWPRVAAVGLMVAVLVRMVQAVRERDRPIVKVASEFDEYAEEEGEVSWPRLAIAVALAVGYVIATMFIGYLFATAIFLALFIFIGGARNKFVPIVAVVGALVFAYVFIGVVYVSLPTGVGVFDSLTVAIYELLGIQ